MISPNDTFTIYLDIDLGSDAKPTLPEDKRPALIYRYGTLGQLRDHERKRAALNSLHGDEYLSAVLNAASFNLVETRSLTDHEGKPTTSIADALTLPDISALARQLALHNELGGNARKNSESPSPSVAAASAVDAPAVPATA